MAFARGRLLTCVKASLAVFRNLQEASQQRHLPALRRARRARGARGVPLRKGAEPFVRYHQRYDD